MELKLEPQSSLSPLQARSILNRWGEDGTALVLTTAFPSLEIGGTVLVSRIESEAIELRTKDGTVWFVLGLAIRRLDCMDLPTDWYWTLLAICRRGLP